MKSSKFSGNFRLLGGGVGSMINGATLSSEQTRCSRRGTPNPGSWPGVGGGDYFDVGV